MSGFESPNYTQTPNDFFAMLPDMFESELRVTLVMIRQTFGFHRDGFKMGVTKLAKAAGLSRQGALDGAELAEKRGTFRRVNPAEQTEAEWELVLYLPLQSVEGDIQSVEGSPLPDGGQVRVKERIKKPIKQNKAAAPKQTTPEEIQAFRKATRKYPNSANYPDVVESVRKVMARLGKENIEDIVIDELSKFYRSWTGKGYNPFNLAWLEWAEVGMVPVNNKSWSPKNANYQGNTGGESYTDADRAAAERIKARRAGMS